jgi:predicted nicotinamide N-methyase
MSDWENKMFSKDYVSGSRLGISYMRAQEPQATVVIDQLKNTINISQQIDDHESISGVVWDAALLLSDFIMMEENLGIDRKEETCAFTGKKRYILDLGCGTGIVGVVASKLCANSEVSFSDMPSVQTIIAANLNLNPDNDTGTDTAAEKNIVNFIPYDWTSPEGPPSSLISPIVTDIDAHVDVDADNSDKILYWDTVFCSDLLYDENMHKPLMKLLHSIKCKRLVFGYKKRHPVAEKKFWNELEKWCIIEVLSTTTSDSLSSSSSNGTISNSIDLVNCTKKMTLDGGGLFAVIAIPRF